VTLTEVLGELRRRARPENLAGMARFGLTPTGRLGVSVPEMRLLARRIGRNHPLALRLWKTGIQEARMLGSMIADPQQLTVREMDAWVRDLDSWDVCDQACMNLFERTPLAWGRVPVWTRCRAEFVKRAGYVLLARLAVSQKTAPDDRFVALLPLIVRGATDDRNYVKKAVSWALRQIGKRSAHLKSVAVKTALEIRALTTPGARWIASDVLRDLDTVLHFPEGSCREDPRAGRRAPGRRSRAGRTAAEG
jgi:3-methyladenine DNA glycosylase AlkD